MNETDGVIKGELKGGGGKNLAKSTDGLPSFRGSGCACKGR